MTRTALACHAKGAEGPSARSKAGERQVRVMKKETWKTMIQVIVSILTAALTATGTVSCRHVL